MKTERSKPHEYRVIDEMNTNDAINLLNPSANRVFQVVAYEDDALRKELATLPAGKLVELKLDRVGARANVWRARRPANVTSLTA
ncbi:hypothetical protein [Halonotius sp. GCM10025705]|uniref:hypothetical protein n=1 Tax=Halonotius sp. GCM10025705 TaxID=3252678 RepID=UPI0036203709